METNIKIQINHKEPITKNLLANILFEQIGEENNLRFDDIIMLFDFNSCSVLPNGSFITIVSFCIPEIELRDITLEEIIFTFIDTINNIESVISVVKFNDTVLEEKAYEYYKEIVSLEMDMRSVLTYIITYDNKSIDNTLFKNFNIKQSESLNYDNMAKTYENGLYYIYFSHYGHFTQPQKLKAEQIVSFLQEPSVSTFEKFKEKLQNRGIFEERHLDFLSSIQTKLKPLEDMRNAIMHIRNLSKSIIENYEKSVEDIGSDKGVKSIIIDFWKKEKEELEQNSFISLAKIEITNIFINANIEEHKFIIENDITDGVLEEDYDELETLQADIMLYIEDNINILNYEIIEEDYQLLNTYINECWENNA